MSQFSGPRNGPVEPSESINGSAKSPHTARKPTFRVALALVHREGRWLAARRHPEAHLGGLWEFPGGKIEGDESPERAAVRELLEECGVAAVATRVLATCVHEYEDRVVELFPIVCRWDRGEARPLGCAACAWVTIDELSGLEMPAVNAEILAELRNAGDY